jgi:hypothetical protein
VTAHSLFTDYYKCLTTAAEPREVVGSTIYSPSRVSSRVLSVVVLESVEYLCCNAYFSVALTTNHVYTCPPLLSYTVADPREVASASVDSSVSVPGRAIG